MVPGPPIHPRLGVSSSFWPSRVVPHRSPDVCLQVQVTLTIVVNTILYDKVGATTVVSDDLEVWVGLAAVVEAKMDSEGRGYNGCNRHFGYPFCL